MAIALIFLLGIALMGAPFIVPAFGLGELSVTLQVLSISLGSLLMIASAMLTVFTRIYQRTKASEAFVRTGMGGAKVIQDGGSVVVPFLHELIRVSLATLKLQVSRANQDALITNDKLRADIHAEFFVRVQPEVESILQASRSLGERMSDPDQVRALVEDKLVSSLRTAAAMKTLEQLNSERDEFLADVIKLVADDLLSNGLILETVTISKLDQTDESFLKESNIFDAQGWRKIAEITQLNLTERNRLVRDGEQARKTKDVETTKELLELDRSEREASARQVAEIAKTESETTRDAQEKAIEAMRRVELAEVEKARQLEVATREQQQAVEVAERAKQEGIAVAEQKRAAAEQALAEAEASRETARQRVETVKVTESAERAKAKSVIDAQGAAETAFVTAQRKADADAYTVQKQAQARKLAADAEAEAVRKKAEASAEAERLGAMGEKAKAMVPVEVQKAKVAVDRERIETVVKPELEAREKHGKVAQDFELAKLRVAAEKEVHIAFAEASAKLFTKMEATLYGTPEDVTKILESVVKGQTIARTVGGFFEAADDTTMAAIGAMGKGVKELAGSAVKKLSEPASEVVETLLEADVEEVVDVVETEDAEPEAA